MLAAIELQIIRDLEIRDQIRYHEHDVEFTFPISEYVPSNAVEDFILDNNTTSKGGSYGASSSEAQFQTIKKAVQTRNSLNLPHEVEWTQFERSYALTKFAIDHSEIQLGKNNSCLNIAILFGFSPKLPFPQTYEEFQRVVGMAKKLAFNNDGSEKGINITITVGAAVVPSHMTIATTKLDILHQKAVSPLERLLAYSSMPDSNVDIIRCGLEDTPAMIDASLRIRPTTNPELSYHLSSLAQKYDVGFITNRSELLERLHLTGLRHSLDAPLQQNHPRGI